MSTNNAGFNTNIDFWNYLLLNPETLKLLFWRKIISAESSVNIRQQN